MQTTLQLERKKQRRLDKAFPVITAAFYCTLARRGLYLKVKASGEAGWLDVITAGQSYRITVANKERADDVLRQQAGELRDTQPGRAFLLAMQLAVTGKEAV